MGQLEIVIPVHNEAATLEAAVLQLHGYLSAQCPFSWQLTVADNASSDRTLAVARRLSYQLPGVDALHLAEKGRGRALRAAWTRSDAEVLCYMDVDLSTDLAALLPLVAPLLCGHSELAIGTRLHPSARVRRGESARSSPAPTTACFTSLCVPASVMRSAVSRR